MYIYIYILIQIGEGCFKRKKCVKLYIDNGRGFNMWDMYVWKRKRGEVLYNINLSNGLIHILIA